MSLARTYLNIQGGVHGIHSLRHFLLQVLGFLLTYEKTNVSLSMLIEMKTFIRCPYNVEYFKCMEKRNKEK
jgi:hypothetical protein